MEKGNQRVVAILAAFKRIVDYNPLVRGPVLLFFPSNLEMRV
jgi:hypothetical protein